MLSRVVRSTRHEQREKERDGEREACHSVILPGPPCKLVLEARPSLLAAPSVDALRETQRHYAVGARSAAVDELDGRHAVARGLLARIAGERACGEHQPLVGATLRRGPGGQARLRWTIASARSRTVGSRRRWNTSCFRPLSDR